MQIEKTIKEVDVAIIVALEEEFEFFAEIMDVELESESLDGYFIYSFDYLDKNRLNRTGIVTFLGDMGNNHSQERAQRLLGAFSPHLLVVVGISGKISDDVKMGDVVVGTAVEDYLHRGKIDPPKDPGELDFSQIKHGGNNLPTDNMVVEFLKNVKHAKRREWQSLLKNCNDTLGELLSPDQRQELKIKKFIENEIKLHPGNIASGPFVGAATNFKEWIKGRIDRNYLALDMESFGVVFAHYKHPYNKRTRTLVVRGISDPADETKKMLEEGYKGALRTWAMINALRIVRMSMYYISDVVPEAAREYIPPTSNQLIKDLHNVIRKEHVAKCVQNLNISDAGARALYSRLLVHFCQSAQIRINHETLFDDILTFIEDSDEVIPLQVDGVPGTGKSVFLSLLYLFAHYKFTPGRNDLIPVYINLQRYNSVIFDSHKHKSLAEQALQKAQQEFASLQDLIHYFPDSRLLIIVDGYDEYAKFGDTIVKFIQTLSQQSQNKKIICLRSKASTKFESQFEKEPPAEWEAKASITFSEVLPEEGYIDQIIHDFIGTTKFSEDEGAFHFIKGEIERLNISPIGLFTLSLLLSFYIRGSKLKMASLSAYIDHYCIRLLSDYSGVTVTDREVINSAAELAFKWEILHEIIPTTVLRNNPGWPLMHMHSRIRDYLCARHIINLLLKESSKKGKNFDPSLRYIYPHRISLFCKEIMNESKENQTKVMLAVEKLTEKHDVSLQAQLAYLAGRVSDRQIKLRAINFLKDFKKKHMRLYEVNKTKGDSRQYLHLLRSIFISLGYLEQTKIMHEYIDFLLDDFAWDSLNRGFHLEFYGDIDYVPNERMLHVDELSDFSKTYHKLYKRIKFKPRENNRLFEVEVHTLLSLAQHRHEVGLLDRDKKDSLCKLITYLIENDLIDHSQLKQYMQMINKNLQRDKFPVGIIIEELYSIKSLPRSGWVARNIPNAESVAEHIYGAYLLGELFLPEQSDDLDYKKDEILKMILIHDLAEAYIGDLLPHEKDENMKRKEIEAFSYLGMMSTYGEAASFKKVDGYWKNFVAVQTINARLARELDKLDNLVQLYIYKKAGHDIADFTKWRQQIRNAVTTGHGRRILKIIDEHFDS